MVNFKWPLMLKSTHDKELEKVRLRWNGMCIAEQEKTQELRDMLEEHLPKLMKCSVNIVDHSAFERYRVCVDLNTDMVRSCLLHGNSRQMIKEMGYYIGRMFEKELYTVNFERLK